MNITFIFRQKIIQISSKFIHLILLGVDSCNGDSGGPLIYRQNNGPEKPWFQIGIVSFGSSLCGIEIPAVYTRVTKMMDWVKRIQSCY